MAKQPKSKTRAANIAVPQNAEEASDFIKRIGEESRRVARIEHDMNDIIATAKADAEDMARGPNERIKALTAGLQMFCDANREKLTDGGKVKFHDFGAGKVEWRHLPPSVRMKAGFKADDVVAWCKAQADGQYLGFIRTKEELDKEAMLLAPGKAANVPGVTIGSAGEQFTVAPVEMQISGAAVAGADKAGGRA